ncbi:MAG: RDD family protein [Gammaproteobacteria bacterium]|nr:RDD family protein [Gammaproteobacteria bacterium]
MPDQDLEYAGFWIRVAASLIDTVLIVVITFPLLFAIYGADYFGPAQSRLIAGPADLLISWVLPAIAIILFWISRQATPGKLALSLRIVDADTGGKLSVGQSVGRYFGYFVSTIPFGLGLIWVAFDKRKQGWHDKLAHTVVIRTKRRGPEPVSFPRAQ